MFRIRMNLAGWFDVYTSPNAPDELARFVISDPAFRGKVGRIVVEDLVPPAPRADLGRNRFLLLITHDMEPAKRSELRSFLETNAEETLVALMGARSQFEAGEDVDRVRLLCARWEERSDGSDTISVQVTQDFPKGAPDSLTAGSEPWSPDKGNGTASIVGPRQIILDADSAPTVAVSRKKFGLSYLVLGLVLGIIGVSVFYIALRAEDTAKRIESLERSFLLNQGVSSNDINLLESRVQDLERAMIEINERANAMRLSERIEAVENWFQLENGAPTIDLISMQRRISTLENKAEQRSVPSAEDVESLRVRIETVENWFQLENGAPTIDLTSMQNRIQVVERVLTRDPEDVGTSSSESRLTLEELNIELKKMEETVEQFRARLLQFEEGP